MDVQVDRLSSLSDDVIHKILSFISIKDAIGTSVLSSRWRFIWTSMPYLNFENLNYGLHISKFISDVLSHRNTQIHVSSVSLVLGKTVRDDESVTRILNYAFSHNVQQLTLTRSPGNIVGRPLSYQLSSFIATPTWDLPALTTLHLHYIQLSDDIGFFSKCTNLKNLSLRRCTLMNGTKGFNICLPQLSNLTLEYICLCLDTELEEYVNVVAPQLKNLTIIWCPGKHLISAPGLVSLVIKGPHPWEISTPGFPSLEKVDLIMHNVPTADAHKIVCLLQKLRSAKLLIIGVGILQRLFRERKHLSSSMELLPPEACVFANAKISKFITKMPVKVFLEVRAQEKVTTSTSHSVMFPMVTRILNYAFSHNVQQLTLTRSPGNIIGRPLAYRLSSFIVTPTWDLPALTTLHLHYIQLSDDIGFFSKCTNLKNLSLRRCTLMKGTKVFNICLPQLSSLTLEYVKLDTELEEYVNVVAPQLKNLTIKCCPGKHLISAPGLVSFVIEGPHPWQISTPGFPSLEKVDLCMYYIPTADAHKIVCLLQQLRSAKLLILGLGILQHLFRERKHLSSSMELLPHEACVFANAKISKFLTKMPVKVFLEVPAQEEVTMSTEIKNYEPSPSVMFPMVSLEEIEAMKDMAEAHKFVKHLGMLLKECKANNTSKTEHGKPQVKKHRARRLQLNREEMMEMIKQSKFVASEICLMATQCMSTCHGTLEIIAWLEEIRSLFQSIKGWMTQLSASKRAVMQPNYNTLCEDAATITNNILGWMKTKNQTPSLII